MEVDSKDQPIDSDLQDKSKNEVMINTLVQDFEALNTKEKRKEKRIPTELPKQCAMRSTRRHRKTPIVDISEESDEEIPQRKNRSNRKNQSSEEKMFNVNNNYFWR